MKRCDCYHEETKTRYLTEFERGYEFGKTGKLPPLTKLVTYKEGKCLGTSECDTCTCGGDRNKCDFYKRS